jgi:hypothetical protein
LAAFPGDRPYATLYLALGFKNGPNPTFQRASPSPPRDRHLALIRLALFFLIREKLYRPRRIKPRIKSFFSSFFSPACLEAYHLKLKDPFYGYFLKFPLESQTPPKNEDFRNNLKQAADLFLIAFVL